MLDLSYAFSAIVPLIHDVLVTVGFLSLFNKELNLPIVAALLTIIGYSINDTIVIFDRIRENMQSQRRDDFARVVNASINQTLSRTILTSATVLMVVLALFFFGGEVIHAFAFALLVGVIAGVYSTVFIASPILVLGTRMPNGTGPTVHLLEASANPHGAAASRGLRGALLWWDAPYRTPPPLARGLASRWGVAG